jgi:hypothetical protein
VKSWGCYCGELFRPSWYKATGTRMWGAIGKTQYMTEELPVLREGRRTLGPLDRRPSYFDPGLNAGMAARSGGI